MSFGKIMIAVLVLALLTGCTSTFTSIEKQPDDSYYLTQVKQGPWFVAGSNWRCVPQGEATMKCKRVSVP